MCLTTCVNFCKMNGENVNLWYRLHINARVKAKHIFQHLIIFPINPQTKKNNVKNSSVYMSLAQEHLQNILLSKKAFMLAALTYTI